MNELIKKSGRGVRTRIAASGLGLALLVASSGGALAGDLPKQGTFSAHWTVSGAYKAIEMGEDLWAQVNEQIIMITNDAGDGLFHNMSGECVGYGLGTEEKGYCNFVDSDGDKIFEQYAGDVETNAATGTALEGTGKYAGIEATFEYRWVNLPSADGAFNIVGVKEGSYTLP